MRWVLAGWAGIQPRVGVGRTSAVDALDGVDVHLGHGADDGGRLSEWMSPVRELEDVRV
jgi:hypothetical protein